MKPFVKEILEELASVFSNKTFDTLLPPLVFVLINTLYTLNMAIIIAITLAVTIVFYRLLMGKTWVYAFSGLIVVVIASAFAYVAGNATDYFLPGIIGSAFFLGIAVVSVIINKPFAAWVSHIVRGWTLAWFWRKDVKPAYMEVTLLWIVFFLIRLIVQVTLYMEQDALQLFWINTLLGLPLTVLVLIMSYVYGIARLRKMGGPGIDEYDKGQYPPYRGQTRGF